MDSNAHCSGVIFQFTIQELAIGRRFEAQPNDLKQRNVAVGT